MKKMKWSTTAVAAALCVAGFGFSAQARSITNIVVTPPHVFWYSFPASGPNDQVIPTFPTWRDTFVNAMVLFAGKTDSPFTSSRLNNPAGIEVKNVFEAGDVAVVPDSDLTDTMWRGVWNPANQHYADQRGNHGYCPILVVGNGVKIQLAGLGYEVQDTKNLLDNKSSLVTNSYSVSRVGIIAGPSGNIFGNDAIIVKDGAGTNMVDAIFFIGGRFGVWVSGQAGFNAFNAYIPADGDKVTYTYSYQWTTNIVTGETTDSVTSVQTYVKDVMLYRQGHIPASYNGMEYFPTPVGILFSLVEPTYDTYTTWVSRQVDGPWASQSPQATTGWSWEWLFTRNPTNDVGFVKFQENGSPSE
jgi:hypothetical protein